MIGQRIQDLLIEDPIHQAGEKIIAKLSSGESWSGQLPFRKRSGEIFMALVTKSLLYEDGELVGIITVSSDAAIFNIINSEKLRTFREPGHDQNTEQGGFNMKKIQWLPKPQSASKPSSVSALVLMSYTSIFIFTLYHSFFFSCWEMLSLFLGSLLTLIKIL